MAEIRQKDLLEIIGISPRQFSRYVKDGVLRPTSHGWGEPSLFDVKQVITDLRRHRVKVLIDAKDNLQRLL